MKLTGAQIVIEELVRAGAKTVFGYPGGMVVNIYDELYKNAHRIEHILTAHEQGAVHAADAYARVTGLPGVVVATSGPGATNLVTGIANAYLDSTPLVAITGNVPVPLLGRDTFQEIDIVGVTQPIVKHNYIVRDIAALQRTLREAFLLATTGRRGPVLVDIPKSVQQETCEYDEHLSLTPPRATPPGVTDGLEDALEAIAKSERPFIYCGGGVVASGAHEYVLELSKKIGAPVGCSIMGLGAVPDSYELSLGMCGMHGRYISTTLQTEADLMIALGVRFSDRGTGNTQEYSRGCTVIHVDIDAAEFGKNVGAKISICGDLKDILPRLVSGSRENLRTEWRERISSLRTVGGPDEGSGFSPKRIIGAVNAHFTPDTVVATDVGQHQMWTAQHYRFEKPRTLITSGGLGTMGFGFGAAIGACIASGRRQTVLFTSEGSFGMNLNEMATAVTQNLPIAIVLLNNGVLGMVRQWQTLFFEGRYAQTTLERKTDFPALARAFGARGYSANSVGELESALCELTDNGGPILIDCRIEPDELVLPMIPPGGSVRDIMTTLN